MVTSRLCLIALAFVVLAILPGRAQDQATATSISPAQEREIRTFVQSEHRISAAVPASFRLSVGATLPQGVELHGLGPVAGVEHLRYAVVAGKIAIVDPGSRGVVKILE